jgi:hypothetical protein
MKKLILLFLLLPVLMTSCFFGGERIKGNGNIKTDERSVSAFDELEVHGAIHLYISQGPLQPVRIEGDENLLQYVAIVEQGDRLEFKTKEGYNLDPSGDLKVYVTTPELRHINVTGATRVESQTKISSNNNMSLHSSGASHINLEIDAPEISADLSGSGEIQLKGETKRLTLDISGAANALCFGLLTEETNVEISGAGNAEVYASKELEAHVSGAGNVRYKGEVKNIKQEVSGAGTVSRVD